MYITIIVVFLTAFSTRVSLLSELTASVHLVWVYRHYVCMCPCK